MDYIRTLQYTAEALHCPTLPYLLLTPNLDSI